MRVHFGALLLVGISSTWLTGCQSSAPAPSHEETVATEAEVMKFVRASRFQDPDLERVMAAIQKEPNKWTKVLYSEELNGQQRWGLATLILWDPATDEKVNLAVDIVKHGHNDEKAYAAIVLSTWVKEGVGLMKLHPEVPELVKAELQRKNYGIASVLAQTYVNFPSEKGLVEMRTALAGLNAQNGKNRIANPKNLEKAIRIVEAKLGATH